MMQAENRLQETRRVAVVGAGSWGIANADLLSCDGKYVYMQEQKFDLLGRRLDIGPNDHTATGGRHLFCQTGFLDDLWFHRSYWIYGEDCGEGWGAYANPRRGTPCGRIMVLDDTRAYAFRSDPLGNMLHPRTQYTLYAASKKANELMAHTYSDVYGIPTTGLRFITV